MSVRPQSEPCGMQPSDILGDGATAVGLLISSLAPTNALLTNPAALKRVFETGGQSLLAVSSAWLDDLHANGGYVTAGIPW